MKRQGLRKICGKRKRQKYLMEIFACKAGTCAKGQKDATASGGRKRVREGSLVWWAGIAAAAMVGAAGTWGTITMFLLLAGQDYVG